jgi:2-keto-4-pentenoate hydratase/2-oxohepta-3-ene-1,7-dioic acid hydratase in catechol pathway
MGAALSVGPNRSPRDFHYLLCIGPVLVSPKIITNPQMLSVKAIYNGQTVQDGNTK